MEYTWKITRMKTSKVDNTDGVIVQTYWEKTGKDSNGIEGTFMGATPFDDGDPTSPDFVPFPQLTEDIVLGWIKKVVVGAYEQHVNEQIQKQIDGKKNPVVEVNNGQFPWSPPSSNTANTPAP